MNEKYALLSGEIDNWPSMEGLFQILSEAGLSLNKESNTIRINDFEHFVFREFGDDCSSPCITADAESVEEMLRQSTVVSEALSSAGIRHRFEIYDSDDQLAAYCHHQWPKDC